MRRLVLFALLPLLACSREAPEPARPAAQPRKTAPAAAAPKAPTWEAAIQWLRTAPRFSFAMREDGTTAEGELTRPRIGQEKVQFRSGGEEWLGEADRQGLVWKRRQGDAWTEAVPPPFAGRLYQRLAVGFDPQKREGSAQPVSTEGGITSFRFTDANTGDVWQARVRGDGSIEKLIIGDSVELTITP